MISNPAIGDLSPNLSPYAFVQIINQSSTTLSDVKIGDEVRVVLSPEDLLVHTDSSEADAETYDRDDQCDEPHDHSPG